MGYFDVVTWYHELLVQSMSCRLASSNKNCGGEDVPSLDKNECREDCGLQSLPPKIWLLVKDLINCGCSVDLKLS